VEENNYQYQYGFADQHADVMYDLETRTQKAQKVLAVLLDYYSGKTKNLKVLDIGCSTGIISYSLSEKFGEVNGIDIDKNAVKFATEKYKRSNLFFAEQDGMHLKYPAGSFDIVVCSHYIIFSHVDLYYLFLFVYFFLFRPSKKFYCVLVVEHKNQRF
jgi:2-polyprenyl-3-methyl-5-hydroxy-6-metoxy-1,4-benzoquinol methylase